MCRQVVHDFDNYQSALSEGKALAVVVKAVPGSPHWRRVGTDCPCPLRQSAVVCGPACARLARRVGGAAREGRKWRERPPDFWRWCATGQGEVVHGKIHHLPSLAGVAPSTVIPGGKAIERKGKRGDRIDHRRCDLRAREADSGSDNPNAVRVETGSVTQHCTGDDMFYPLKHSGGSGLRQTSRTV